MGLLRIGPFNYDPLRGADLWLAQTDEFLLQHLSTSPDVEPPHFALNVSRNYLLSVVKRNCNIFAINGFSRLDPGLHKSRAFRSL